MHSQNPYLSISTQIKPMKKIEGIFYETKKMEEN
jgi:hypothetical protein